MLKTLQVKQINFEGGTQARVKLDTDVVDAYAEVLTETNGDALPPIDVYSDGTDYWLSDGFHRFHAHVKVGLGTIKANVHTGTRRDAILASVGANAEHGLKRSNADKRKAVKMLLDDQEWSQRSDRWIAEKAKVSDRLVNNVRNETTANIRSSRIGQDGKERKLPEQQPTPQQQVKDFFDDKPKQASEPEPEPEQPSGSIVLDCCGNPVPENLRAAYEASIQLNAIGRELDKLKRAVSEISDLPGGEFVGSHMLSGFKVLKDDVTYCGYFSYCPRCNGENGNCTLCGGSGWMPKKHKGHLTPSELEELGVQ